MFEAWGPVNDAIIIIGMGGRWQGDGKIRVPRDKLKCTAIGGVNNLKAVRVVIAKAGAKVGREAKVRAKVDKLGEQDAAV